MCTHFYCYYKCFREYKIRQLVSEATTLLRTTHFSIQAHPFCKQYVFQHGHCQFISKENSIFSRTVGLSNTLPVDICPGSYNLEKFKLNALKHTPSFWLPIHNFLSSSTKHCFMYRDQRTDVLSILERTKKSAQCIRLKMNFGAF